MKDPNYHVCFVGPIPREELDEKFPNGEGHIRHSNEEAFFRQFGRYPESTGSGWGCTEEMRDDMSFCWYEHETKIYIIRSYLDEGIPFPSKVYEAYYMFLKSTGEL